MGMRGKVTELLAGLMGSRKLGTSEDGDDNEDGHGEGGEAWQWGDGDEVLGWSREALLREVVGALGRQRELQRVTVPYARVLGMLDDLGGGANGGGEGERMVVDG